MKNCMAIATICAAATIMVAATAGAQEKKEEKKEDKGFELCNRTKLTVRYAMALNRRDDKKKRDDILSEGWFILAPQECKILWPGALKYRYYLIYAEARNSNRRWAGKTKICTSDGDFKITGGVCPSGRNSRNFIEVDTGDSDEFTYDLD